MARWLKATVAAALLGYGVGWVAGAAGVILAPPYRLPFLAERVPLPHHVPKYPGGVSFRFAMAHDVIHERFPKHGSFHYEARNRLTRARLDSLAPDDPQRDDLEDDLGAGLERLGRTDEAVAILRSKLERQRKRGLSGRALYTTYANLGTFLIHGSFKRAISGDPTAKAQFNEGVQFVRRSVEVNPEAHFGREQWQAAIAEFLLASIDNPKRLMEFDCLGNRLDAPIESLLDRELNWHVTGYGRPFDADFAKAEPQALLADLAQAEAPSGATAEAIGKVREFITKVGAEEGWEAVAVPSHRAPVAFDEPMLGIIGMWRQGGGANPFFALAIGETMLRVGQRYIAWSAFERASLLADRYSPDPKIQAFLREHCARRQREIEETLRFRADPSVYYPPWQYLGSPPPVVKVEQLRIQFDRELAFGQSFQKAYQDFEEERLRSGHSIDEAGFYDDFWSGRKPIASTPGSEEYHWGVSRKKQAAYVRERQRGFGVLGGGLATFIVSSVLYVSKRWRVGARGASHS